MFRIRYVEPGDREFWLGLDDHLPEAVFDRKVRDREGYVLLADGAPVGLLRYNLFWDNTPFCTLLCVGDAFQGRGGGRRLMERWERDMREAGYGMAMVSTQVDETAQHFYQKLGYRDAGGFVIDIPGFAQPMELIMIKELTGEQEGRM